MTITEAERIRRDFYRQPKPSREQQFLFIEAMEFLIDRTSAPGYMMELGGLYYEEKRFDLALKYYDLAAELGYLDAFTCLGYIWYYGRTGQVDYKKAFEYYSRARDMGDLVSAYKVADMYKNGYYVERDTAKYESIIEDLYKQLKHNTFPGAPLVEVLVRLGGIRAGHGDTAEALRLYDQARELLSRRIRSNPFFGNLSIMKHLIFDIYQLRQFDPMDFELYDLYHLLRSPVRVTFSFIEEPHRVNAVEEDGRVVIQFDDTWYRTIDDFFAKASVNGEPLTSLYEELMDFEVL